MRNYLCKHFDMLSNYSLISEAKKTHRGSFFVIEIIKFIIVCSVFEYMAGCIISFLNSNHIPLFSSIGQPQILFGIGLQSLGALMFCYIYEDMYPKHLGIVKKGLIKDTFKGYIIGTLLIGIACLILLIIGSVNFTFNIDIKYLPGVLILFLVYFFQAFGEEVMYRGYFMISMARKNNIIIAVIISSAIFSIHHYHSPGYGIIPFLNLFLLGVLLSVLMIKRGNIWISTGVHSAWNFVQGNVFGINVSGGGQNNKYTIFAADKNWGNALFGGEMGLEGSIVVFVILLAFLAFIIFKNDIIKFLQNICQNKA